MLWIVDGKFSDDTGSGPEFDRIPDHYRRSASFDGSVNGNGRHG
jgi:hypothetical protein